MAPRPREGTGGNSKHPRTNLEHILGNSIFVFFGPKFFEKYFFRSKVEPLQNTHSHIVQSDKKKEPDGVSRRSPSYTARTPVKVVLK